MLRCGARAASRKAATGALVATQFRMQSAARAPFVNPMWRNSQRQPQLSEEEAAKVEINQNEWPEEFKEINITMIKRLSLLACELASDNTEDVMVVRWRSRYGCKPSEITESNEKVLSQDKKTQEVFMEDINRFKSARAVWDTDEFKKAFEFL